MAVLADPDDETAGMGSTFAYHRERGVRTSLVMATLGKRGWNGPPSDDAGPQAMARLREGELTAAALMGIDEISFLDYLDGELDRRDPHQAIARIVTHLRRLRLQVVVSSPSDGAYGHPDHIAVSQLTASGLVCAADAAYFPGDGRPHRTDKFWNTVASRETLQTDEAVVADLSTEVDGCVRRVVSWNDWGITTRLPRRPTGEPRCARCFASLIISPALGTSRHFPRMSFAACCPAGRSNGLTRPSMGSHCGVGCLC